MIRSNAAKVFGLALSGVCLVYFVMAARRILASTPGALADASVLQVLPLASVPYLAAYAAFALAWHQVSRALGVHSTPRLSAGIYLTTQIGKYLPGNVGQHVGRVYLSARHALPVARIGTAMAVEILMVVFVAASFSLPLLPLVLRRLEEGGGSRPAWYALVVAVAAGAGLVAYAARRHPGFSRFREPVLAALRHMHDRGWSALFRAFACIVAGVALTGVCLAYLALTSSGNLSPHQVVMCVAVFSAAWIVGFLAPGAPAGVGVREAMLLAGLTPVFNASTAVQAAVLFRVISVAADLIALLAGMLLLRSHTPAPLSGPE